MRRKHTTQLENFFENVTLGCTASTLRRRKKKKTEFPMSFVQMWKTTIFCRCNRVLWESKNALHHYVIYQEYLRCDAMLRHSPIFRSLLPPDFHYLPSFLLHSSIHQLWNINNLQLLPSLFYLFRCSFSNVPQHDCVELNVKRAALP